MGIVMTYEQFKQRVRSYCARAGLQVRFSIDDGKYIAVCDDVKFVGNPFSKRPSVMWGDGHVALMPEVVLCIS